MDVLYYILVLVAVAIVGVGGVWLKRKYSINEDEVQLLYVIMDIADYLTSKFDFKYQTGVTTVIGYCIMAVNFVEEYETIEDEKVKAELIKDKAVSICDENGLAVDDGLVEIVDLIIDYVLE